MLLKCLILLVLVVGTTPSPPRGNHPQKSDVQTSSGQEDVTSQQEAGDRQRLRRSGMPPIPSTFRHIYVHENGALTTSQGNLNLTIEVGGSPLSSYKAIQTAAHIVSLMTRHMGSVIFHNLATSGTAVGTFTRTEKLIVYPKYANYSNEGCGRSCEGSCAHTCTSDHRKMENLAGIGGGLAVILEDNLLCTSTDPYRHGENILVHEFSHTIHSLGLTQPLKDKVHAAYNQAKQNGTWVDNSYAMSNHREYFAEAVTVFMGVNKYSRLSSGGMNLCHGAQGPVCATEKEGRQRLADKDPMLYQVLVTVFTNDRPLLMSDMTVCPPQ